MGCGGSKEKKGKEEGPQPVKQEAPPAKEPEKEPVVEVVVVSAAAKKSAAPEAPEAPVVAKGISDELERLLPGGEFPPECQYWLDFEKTCSTKGKLPQAQAVVPWIIAATKLCHLDRKLKQKLREFMATERLVSNMLFLGIWKPMQNDIMRHLVHLGSRLDAVYKELDLGNVFSDAALAGVCRPHPEFAGKRVTQALCIPGLTDPKHFNYDTPATMDETVALHVLMLVTLAVDDGYQTKMAALKGRAEKELKAQVKFAKAPPKSFARANNKQSSPTDYRFEAKPRSMYNIDVSRNLVSAKDPKQVFALLKLMNEEFGGYAKLKNLFVLSEYDRKNRFHLLSIMMTVCFRSGRTFKEVLADPAVQAKWKQYIEEGMENEPAERWARHTARAMDFLKSPHLQDEEVKLMCETQILLDAYTSVRSEMHEPYRIGRAADPASLFHDFARSAGGDGTNKDTGERYYTFRSPGSTLINACNRGQADVARKFIASGQYTVDHANKANKCTGLYMACVNGHADVVAMLIELKCDVNAARDTGATPVYIAAERGHTDVLKLLVQAGANVNKARTDKWGPLQNNCRRDYHDVVDELIKGGADVNQSSDSSTPLQQAKEAGVERNIKALIAAGATQ